MLPTSRFTDLILAGFFCGVWLFPAFLLAAEPPAHPEQLTLAQTVDAWLAVLEDPAQSPVRRNFAGARIVSLGPPALPRLIELYPRADLERRGTLALLLGAFDPDAARDAIPLLLDDFNRLGLDVHPNVIKALGDLHVAPAVPRLLKLLPNASKDARTGILYALAQIADPRAFDVLLTALDDPDRIVRNAAANGLVNILSSPLPAPDPNKTPEDLRKAASDRQLLFEHLLDFIQDDHPSDSRTILIDGLGSLWTPPKTSSLSKADAQRPLIRVLGRSTQPPEIRMAAAAALGRLQSADAVPDLSDLFSRSDDPVLRHVALDALVAVGDPSCASALIDYIQTAPRFQDPARERQYVTERREIVSALQRLTGQSFADNPAQWRQWWISAGSALANERKLTRPD